MARFLKMGLVILIALSALPVSAAKPVTVETPIVEEPVQDPQAGSDTKGNAGAKGGKKEADNPDASPDPEEDISLEESTFSTMSLASTSDEQADVPYFTATNFQVDPFTGSASLAIPIGVPRGRGGIQPSIALTYSSSAVNGPLGVGWSLEFGYIQRSIKKGVPRYDSSDTFQLVQAGSPQNLVYDSAAGYYRPETEGAFMRIEHVGAHWQVTDRQGVIYVFGESANGRVADPLEGMNIFQWHLEKVKDLFGNEMTFTYEHHGQQIYPSLIEYTGNPAQGLVPYARVEFTLESRPDAVTRFHGGFEMLTNQRIASIATRVEGQLQSRYDLTYTGSPATDRSLLKQITQVGADGVSTLPPTTFVYENEKGFQLASGWTIPAQLMMSKANSLGGYTDLGVRIVDINADAYPDFVRYLRTCSGDVFEVYLHNKINGWSLSSEWTRPQGIDPLAEDCDNKSPDHGVRLVDINGDGYPDWVMNFEHTRARYAAVRLNAGDGTWIDDPQWTMPPSEITHWENPYSYYGGVALTDVNLDGYPDYVKSNRNAYPGHEAYINNMGSGGKGWTRDVTWDPPDATHTNLTRGTRMLDVNGDGMTDFLYHDGSNVRIQLNDGAGWREWNATPYTEPGAAAGGGFIGATAEVADINGDGLADILVGRAQNPGASRTHINTGYGWLEDSDWVLPDAIFGHMATRLLDANADGMLDYLIHFNGNAPKLYLNTGKPADRLVAVENGLGARSDISYKPSSSFQNTFLPFVVQVVDESTVSSGLGDAYTTRYDYADGYWDPDEREFRGFGTVKVTDPEGNYGISLFKQDAIYKGRPIQQESYDVSGRLYSRKVNTWDHEPIVPGVDFVHRKREDSFVFDGDATFRQTASEYFYEETPQRGNLTRTVQLGEVGVSGDERSVETDYHNNITVWLLGIPKEIRSKDAVGSLTGRSWFYYDDSEQLDAMPSQGLLTKRVEDAGDEANPVNRYFYDVYGNLTRTQDARGHESTVGYDSTYHLFPVTTANALGHSGSTAYYGVSGEPLAGGGYEGLWGQVKSTTDANGQTGARIYDVFGRPTASISPLDSVTLPGSTVSYDVLANHTLVTSTQRIEHGGDAVMTSYAFYDSLGRLIHTKSPAAVSGQYVVSGLTDYNSRGMPEKKYLPFFSSDLVGAVVGIPADAVASEVRYDAMGRMIESRNPDGSYASVIYDDWTMSSIDENGHKQESRFDAYGQLTEKHEYTGADGRSPHYPGTGHSPYATTRYFYDSRGNLERTVDAHSNATTIIYDQLGRKRSLDDPDMGFWQYEYDANGNLFRQTDAKGQVITFTYDPLNRLIRKTDGADLNVIYTYDDPGVPYSKGRLTRVTYNSDEQTSFAYDALGREVSSTKIIEASPHEIRRSYDALNRLTDMDYPDGEKLYYRYNKAGQVIGVANDPALLPPEVGPQSRLEVEGSEHDVLWQRLHDGIVHFYTGIIEPYVLGVGTAQAQSLEDFTTFVENDPSSRITVTPECFTYNYIYTYRTNAYLYKQSGPFNEAAFTFDTYYYSGYFYHEATVVWGLSDTAGQTYDKWNSGIALGFYHHSRNVSRLRLYNVSNGVLQVKDSSVLLNDSQRYYVHVAKSLDSVTVSIYSDEARTILVDTITGVFPNNQGEYLYAFSASVTDTTNKKFGRGEVCNLTIDSSGGQPSNQAPQVNAGSDVSIDLSQTVNLVGVVSDDGLPNPPGVLMYQWSQISGPGSASFLDPASRNTVVVFDTAGSYVLRLTVNDAELQASDEVTVTVEEPGDDEAPSVPVNLRSTQVTTTSIGLAWDAATDNVAVTGYQVYRNGVEIATPTQASYTNNGLTAGTEYFYTVKAKDAAGNASAASSALLVMTLSESPPLAGPVLESAQAGDSKVSLNWSGVSGASGYKVHWGTASGSYPNMSDVGNVTAHDITGLTNGTTVYVAVTAYDGDEESVPSNERASTPAAPAGPLPEDVIDFSGYTIQSYIPSQDIASLYEILDNGATLRITGNGWKKISHAYTVTPDTVLEFDFVSGSQGEIHAIGFVSGDSESQGSTFKLYGSQTWAITDYADYASAAPGTKHYRIPLGEHFTGSYSYLVFVNDDDVSNPSAESVFRNVRIYEDVEPPAPAAGAFEQDSGGTGLVVMEAEHYHFKADQGAQGWQSTTSRSGFMGEGAMQVPDGLGAAGYGNDKSDLSPRMDYKVYFNRTGTHYVWGRGIGPDGNADSFHAGINGVAVDSADKISSFPSTGWSWSRRTMDGSSAATIHVPSIGEHTVSVWMREDGFFLDRLLITSSSSYGPSGTGPVESSRAGYTPLGSPVLSKAEAGNRAVTLYWEAVAGADGYKVHWGTASASYSQSLDAGSVTIATIDGLANGTEYFFAVSGYDETAEGTKSSELSVTPQPPAADEPTLYISDVQYNAAGQVEKVVYGNGTVTTYEYDRLNLRLNRLSTVDDAGVPIQDLSYTYDSVGNILSITDAVHSADQTFEYDSLNRLTKATGQTETYGSKTYRYDEIGNILEKDGRTYTYGENGAGPHAVTSLSDGSQFGYDANGNMISRSENGVSTSYAFDAENRLREVVRDNVLIATMDYDGDGGRTRKTIYDSQSAGETCFIGGTQVILADGTTRAIEDMEVGDEVLTFDESNGRTSTAAVTHVFQNTHTSEYYWLNDGLGVTGNHHLYREGAWAPAAALKEGDHLLNSELAPVVLEKVKKVTVQRVLPVYNIEVEGHHNYFVKDGRGESYLAHNKMSFGALFENTVTSSASGSDTVFVGGLYEEEAGFGTKFIYLGDTRVASVRNGKALYYHADHLGGTNVLTDEEGTKKQVLEYAPFGSITRNEKFGTEKEQAWHAFTGQRYDSEIGLYFYNARYYDSELGRFVTADDIVQAPGDPQTLNRYSYTSNNPVNRVDPSGHGWFSKLFKAIKETLEYVTNPVKWHPIVNGIVTGDWTYARDMAIAGATGFVFGGPVGAATAMATTAYMRTPIAQFHVKNNAEQIFDDVLGMSPRSAYMASYITYSTAVSLGFERGISNLMAEQGVVSNFDINNPEHVDAAREAGYGYNSFGGGDTTTNPSLDANWYAAGEIKIVRGGNGKIAVAGARPYVVGSAHTGAISPQFPRALNMKNPSFVPFHKGTTFGFCHQATNATLLRAGFSNVVTDIFPNYSTYATTFLYGNYGGGLVQKAHNGYQANSNWKQGRY